MSEKSIKRNMLMSVLLTTSNFIFPLITYSYVTRILHPTGIGRVSFVSAVLQCFTYFAVLGIPAYGVREVSKVRDNKKELSKLVGELFTLGIISTLVSYFLLLLSILVIPRFHLEYNLFIVMGPTILASTIGMEWLYQAFEEYTYITLRSIVFRIVSVVLTFFLVKDVEDVPIYGFVFIFAGCASGVTNFIHIRKYVRLRVSFGTELFKHFRPVMILFAASVVITVYSNFDILMIGFLDTESEVGLYNSAIKIKWIILSVSTAITSVLIPKMTLYLSTRDDEKADGLIEKSVRVSMAFAIPLAVYVFAFAEDCVLLLCGEEYIDAVPTLRILLICIIPLVLTNLFGNQILIPSGNEKRYSQSVFIGMWINIGFNCLLIPRWGAFGAAIATLTTECWNVYWMGRGVKEYVKRMLKNVDFLTYIIPTAMAILFCVMISYTSINNIIIKLFVNSAVFFSVLLVSYLLEKEQVVYGQWERFVRMIKNHIKKR